MRDAEKQSPRPRGSSSSGRASNAPSASASVGSAADLDAGPSAPRGMLLVPAGKFTMGSDASRNERPQHTVRITRDYFMDATETTVESYASCVKDKACTSPRFHSARGRSTLSTLTACNSLSDPSFARQPVNCVTYEQSVAFCKHEGKRLPTEAEWEYAARGSDGRTYPWGEGEAHSCRYAITGGAEGPCGARKGTYEVATTIDGKSPFGLYDMVGNVWEWVADDFYEYGKDELVDPILPPRSSKGVIRGGSWDYNANASKTYARYPMERNFALNNVGFRCAKEAP
jgi:formylglycine-generating enzyme required for sulfatase activity